MTSRKIEYDFENFSELINAVKEYNPKAQFDEILRACKYSYKAHQNQKRASGEPFFVHLYEVSIILANLKMDSYSIIAGLLHDIIEDTELKEENILNDFNEEILELVTSVTKLEAATKDKAFEFNKDKEEMRAENIRKILLATSKDVRVIIIKLADRLHNMRTLKHLPEKKQKIIARETLEIYSPIAQKLGMNSIKAELEDLSFRFLDPDIYAQFKNKINKKKEEREEEVQKIIKEIKKDLQDNNIEARVHGRAKHFYSIYKKITKRNKEFNEIYDLLAIRIITKNIKDCYAALGTVHKKRRPMPGKFKDYIAVPKSNGYQSLHTTVVGKHGKILEVQIRSEDMHMAAEEGIAAHWRYKGTETDKKFDRQIEWLKQILDWKRFSEDAKGFIENMKVDLFEKEIFVFTPKGDPICLPENSTPVDFAYAVHTDVGNHCSKAKINGNIAPLDTILYSGDIVEIITQKNAKPSRSWLAFVQSPHARSKIKSFLNIKVDINPKKIRNDEIERRNEEDLKNMNISVGNKKFPIKISKCCHPKIGDEIIGFKTKDNKIAIHRRDCVNINHFDKEKQVTVKVKDIKPPTIFLQVSVEDKIGTIAKVLSIISEEKLKLVEVNTRSGKDKRIIMNLEILKNGVDFEQVIKKIKSDEDVLAVQILK